jgi:hypothetical protein
MGGFNSTVTRRGELGKRQSLQRKLECLLAAWSKCVSLLATIERAVHLPSQPRLIGYAIGWSYDKHHRCSDTRIHYRTRCVSIPAIILWIPPLVLYKREQHHSARNTRRVSTRRTLSLRGLTFLSTSVFRLFFILTLVVPSKTVT